MTKINITHDIISAFTQIVKGKSTYLGFIIEYNKLFIYSELNEIYFLTVCNTECQDKLSLRLPVEVMRILMNAGYITIERIEENGNTSELIASYSKNGKLLYSARIASEYSDTEDTVKQLITSVVNTTNFVHVEDTSIFRKAIQLVRIDYKELGLTGVCFNKGKVFTRGAGFSAYRNDNYNLNLVISTSTLKELATFAASKPYVNIFNANGFNICYCDSNIFAWRRQRNVDADAIPPIEYDLSVTLPTFNLAKAFRFITSEVYNCYLNLEDAVIEIETRVGYYKIPLDIEPIQGYKSLKLNFKLLSKLLANADDTIFLELNHRTIHIVMEDTHYYIGVDMS